MANPNRQGPPRRPQYQVIAGTRRPRCHTTTCTAPAPDRRLIPVTWWPGEHRPRPQVIAGTRRPRCHTTTATSSTGRLQFQAPRHRPGGNAAQVPTSAKVQPRHPLAQPADSSSRRPGTGPAATRLRFRHQPKSNPDTHWLNRQTPVPGKPGGQPGPSARRPGGQPRRLGLLGARRHAGLDVTPRQQPAQPADSRPRQTRWPARPVGQAPRWPAPAAWSSRRPSARRPRCRTPTGTAPAPARRLIPVTWWPGEHRPRYQVIAGTHRPRCRTTKATSPTGRLQRQAPGGQHRPAETVTPTTLNSNVDMRVKCCSISFQVCWPIFVREP